MKGDRTPAAAREAFERAAAVLAERVRPVLLEALEPYEANTRKHSAEQVATLEASLLEYGWTRPILYAPPMILAGHGITTAALNIARRGGCPRDWPDPWSAPAVDLSHMGERQRREYIIADNKLAEGSTWDQGKLRAELTALAVDGADLKVIGFRGEELTKLLHPVTGGVDVMEVDVSPLADTFWVTVAGPMADQPRALQRLNELMAEFPGVTVELGTVKRTAG